MAVMNFGQIRDYVRAKVLDMDETNYGLDEPQLGREVNAAYLDFMAKVDKSVGELFTVSTTTAMEYTVLPEAPYPRNIILAEIDGRALERMEVPELRSIIYGSLTIAGVPSTGDPAFWALYQVYGSPVSYQLYLYPDNDPGLVVSLYGARNPVELSADEDISAVTEPEAYWIGMIAAVRVATLLGRAAQAGFIEGLVRDLPDDIVLAMGLQQQFTRPRPRQGEEPV